MPKKKKAWTNQQADSDLELKFIEAWVKDYPMYRPVAQYRFHPSRMFRFDYCWVQKKTAIEIQGYGPGHNSLPGMTQDYDKLMEALLLNWRVIYITSMHLSQTNLENTLDKIAQILSIKPISRDVYIPLKDRRKC